ncbi:hypothetical protein L3X38_031290 [Prunus dulcis]|uniref:40S ribosomal protein S21 n=3 Tax=Prunus TaxID=3754 RepID=A0AAD4VC72_PRUDU|nr:hypothetical protein L3X38_031290 [Prunus dulcis]
MKYCAKGGFPSGKMGLLAPIKQATHFDKVRHNHLPCALNLIHSTLPVAEVDSLTKMQNEEGVITELYIPRKCSATNRLITSKDHASVQINVGHLDENGIYTGQFSTFALCGYVRAQGDADGGLDRLWQKKKAEVKQH